MAQNLLITHNVSIRKTPLTRKKTGFFGDIAESEEKMAKRGDREETPLQTAEEETQEACGAVANEKPGKSLL